MLDEKVSTLIDYFNQFERFSIAVSGGIDSMLLAYIATRFSRASVTVIHAFSPAVPEQAFKRVNDHAEKFNWNLKVINAKEFEDPSYINNPVNRCYFCKSNLYGRISDSSDGVIFSGTNLDDLGDFRPGLEAAKENYVKHPYVNVGIDKQLIYKIAEYFGLDQLHSLPAQPCLSSRVETGISINADDLTFINTVEEKTREILPETTDVRCRITHQGTFLELGLMPAKNLIQQLTTNLTDFCSEKGKIFSGIRLYQKGSAFLNGVKHG